MDIKISRTGKACLACERGFSHEEAIVSCVRIEEGRLDREDFCKNCWSPAAGKTAYSVWTHQYNDPDMADPAATEALSPLRRLFYDAATSEDRIEGAVAYLAAQLLRRQKAFRLIKEADSAEDEAKVLLFSDRIGGRLIEVRDPDFSYAELETGRTRLMERLQALEQPDADSEKDASGEGAAA